MKKRIGIILMCVFIAAYAFVQTGVIGDYNYKLGWFGKDDVYVKSITIKSQGTASTINGNAYIRGLVTFSTTSTSVSARIVGTTANDIFVVSPKASDRTVLPVASDFCNWRAVKDSLYINRPAAAATSGLIVSWIRIK